MNHGVLGGGGGGGDEESFQEQGCKTSRGNDSLADWFEFQWF